jgi:hypothetical protein
MTKFHHQDFKFQQTTHIYIQLFDTRYDDMTLQDLRHE